MIKSTIMFILQSSRWRVLCVYPYTDQGKPTICRRHMYLSNNERYVTANYTFREYLCLI